MANGVREHQEGVSRGVIYEKLKGFVEDLDEVKEMGFHLEAYIEIIKSRLRDKFEDMFECEWCGMSVDVTQKNCPSSACRREYIDA